MLNSWDWLVIVAYLVFITAVGVHFYSRDASLREYLLGSKAMRWLPVGLSMLAADVSSITYLGTSAWTFQADLKLNGMIFAYLLAIPIVVILFLPIYARANLFTAYQYLEQRFDLRLRLFASVLFLFLRGCHCAVVIYVPALILSTLMGIPLYISVAATGLLTAFYTMMGGIKGVIWTDSIQVGTILLSLGMVTVAALHNVPGGLHEVVTTGAAFGKFRLFDFSLNFHKVDNFWALLIGGSVLYVESMGTDQAVMQKYLTTKSERETAKSVLFFCGSSAVVSTFLSLLGIVLFVVYKAHPALSSTLHNPDALIPHFVAHVLPHGLAGLVIASVFAGSMATVSASLNSLATSSVVDIYGRILRVGRSESHYSWACRWSTLLWGGLTTLGAFYAGRLGPLILAFNKILSIVGGVILGIFLGGMISQRTTGADVIRGGILGLGLVLYFAVATQVSMFWYPPVGCAGTLIISWLSSEIRGHHGNSLELRPPL